MSIKVEISELSSELERYGSAAFVLTAPPAGRPHIIQVDLRLVDGVFLASPGRSCSRNVAAQPELSLLWPAFEEGGYSLIVDGVGALRGDEQALELVVTPTNAVLHRPAKSAES